MHQCAHNVEPWPTMDQTYVIIIPVVSMNSGRRGNYTDVIKMMKYVLILFCFIHCVTRTTCRRMETMTIEDQLNIFAGIDMNMQVQQMARGTMRADVRHAIEIAMKRKKELEVELMQQKKGDDVLNNANTNKNDNGAADNNNNKNNVPTTKNTAVSHKDGVVDQKKDPSGPFVNKSRENVKKKSNTSFSHHGRRLVKEIPIPYRHEEYEKKRIKLQREYDLKKQHIFIEDSPLNSTILMLQHTLPTTDGNTGQPYEYAVTTSQIGSAFPKTLKGNNKNKQVPEPKAFAVPTQQLGNPFDDYENDDANSNFNFDHSSLYDNHEVGEGIKLQLQNKFVNNFNLNNEGTKKIEENVNERGEQQRRLYSKNEIINNVYGQPFFPQRNNLFPRVAVIRRLPTLEERPPRIAIPVITSEVQQYRWLVSKAGWKATLPVANKLWGEGKDLIDGNLDTRVHLKMSSDTWVLFDLQKSHSITGFRIFPAWSNGPKRVKIQFAGRESGPFIDAAEFKVDGENGGSYVVVRWQGKEMQGYRNEGLQTSKFFDAGIVPRGRYFRLFIMSSWEGKYGKKVEGGGVPEQVVVTEVQFFGRQIQLGLTGTDREACSYGYIYNKVVGECQLAG